MGVVGVYFAGLVIGVTLGYRSMRWMRDVRRANSRIDGDIDHLRTLQPQSTTNRS